MYRCKSIYKESNSTGNRIAIFIASFIVSFSFLYSTLSFLFYHVPQSSNMVVPLILLPLIYPLHKGIHVLALILVHEKIECHLNRIVHLFFKTNITIKHPIAKWKYIFALVAPLIFLSVLFLSFIYLFPTYGYVFVLSLSLNFSISSHDLISLKDIKGAPKKSYIEEHDEGYNILTTSISTINLNQSL